MSNLEARFTYEGKTYTFTPETLRRLEQVMNRVALVTLSGDDLILKLFEPTTGQRDTFTFRQGDTVLIKK
jgi:hypothetical protein